MRNINLEDFYRKSIKAIGLYVDEEGYIFDNEEDKTLITVNGKPAVIPTKAHINSIYVTDDEGKLILSKLPYNPLSEDFKGESKSLSFTRNQIENRLGLMIYGAGLTLLTVVKDVSLQSGLPTKINMLLGSLNEIKKGRAQLKNLVDSVTLTNWDAIYNNSKNSSDYINIYLKKQGIYDGVKYNRLATLQSKVLERLQEATKEDNEVYGVRLRPKDIEIFKLVFKFILNDLNEDNLLSIGSNDRTSSGFISLMKIYNTVAKSTNSILLALKKVYPEYYDTLYVKELVTDQDLLLVPALEKEISAVPSEIDLQRSLQSKAKVQHHNMGVQESNHSTHQVNTPVQYVPQVEAESDPVMRAMRSGMPATSVVIPTSAPMQQQFIQQPMVAQPMVQQPIYQPQMVQQPMVAQPMVQQPVYQQQPRQLLHPVSPMAGVGIGGIATPNIGTPASYWQPPVQQYQQPVGVWNNSRY